MLLPWFPPRPPLVSASASGEGVVHDVDVQDQSVVHQPQTGVSLDQLKELLGSFSRSFDEKFAQMSNRIDSLSQDVPVSNVASFQLPLQ